MKSQWTKWRGIRRDWLPKLWLWTLNTSYLSHKAWILIHTYTAFVLPPMCHCIFNNSQQVSLSFLWSPVPVHDYCSSWQLVDLNTVLETPILDCESLTLDRGILFFSLKVGLCLTWRPVLPSSVEAQRALPTGKIRNRMFVLLPSPGSFSELHLSPIKAAPAKLFSAVKAHESYYAPPSNPILSPEIESALSPPLSINAVLVKWVNEWMQV